MEQYLPYVSLLIAFLGLYFNGRNSKRTDVKEIEEKAMEQARVNAKLDNLTSLSMDLRGQILDFQKQQSDIVQRLAKVESSTKSAHNRIDDIMSETGK